MTAGGRSPGLIAVVLILAAVTVLAARLLVVIGEASKLGWANGVAAGVAIGEP